MMEGNDLMEPARTSSRDAAHDLAGCVSSATVIRQDEPLARRTTLRVGGPADIYIEPASEADLAAVVRYSNQHNLPLFVLGRGSNLLVKDGGFRGVVISLAQPHFSRIEVETRALRCGAGAKLKTVAVEAKRNGLAGLEFFEGIPGTVGGALRMNAGAMGGATFDRVVSVRLMDLQGEVRECAPGELKIAYRSCASLKTQIALSAVFRGEPGAPAAIEQRMHEFSHVRWATQPAAPSAGCMFKNPLTIPAGRLIDELGLKGTRIGGASVSTEHGNFIVNDGTATAREILDLIESIRQHARSKRSIELETEVQIIGEDLKTKRDA